MAAAIAVLGDTDLDGRVTLDDAIVFETALNRPEAYERDFGLLGGFTADINEDGFVNAADADLFADLLGLSGLQREAFFDSLTPSPVIPAPQSLIALVTLLPLCTRRRCR